MKKTWLLLLVALLFALALLFACGGSSKSSSSTPADDDDDASPADDDDDDDLSPGSVTLANVTQSACLSNSYDPMTSPIDVILPSWDKGVLKIENLYAYANCGFKLAPTVSVSGNTVTITEAGTGTAAHCECPYTFNYEIQGIDIPGVTLVVMRQDLGGGAPVEIFNLALPLGSENKAWVVPYVEVFAAAPPPTDPFVAAYAVCYFYHPAEQLLFMTRLDQGLYHAFSYDWYDIDNPGTPHTDCASLQVNFGTLPAGAQHFGAPSYTASTSSWSMTTFDATIP
jgi:hypothetical protein